jgi:hypothetical protein
MDDIKTWIDCFTDEELEQYTRLTAKLEASTERRLPESDKTQIENPSYFYGNDHPEYTYPEGVTHLFLTVKTELHQMDEECSELLDINQIAHVSYHVVVKPEIDPVNLTKDFLDHLDKSIDTSYVNIEKAKEQQEKA